MDKDRCRSVSSLLKSVVSSPFPWDALPNWLAFLAGLKPPVSLSVAWVFFVSLGWLWNVVDVHAILLKPGRMMHLSLPPRAELDIDATNLLLHLADLPGI